MNPGVLSLLVLIVLSVLFITGWGTRYVRESQIGTGSWFVILLVAGFLSSIQLQWEQVQIHLSSLFLVFLAMGYTAVIHAVKNRFHYIIAIITAASVCLVLMVLVPHDPAFYFVDANFLYPLCTLLVAYLFSRKPLFCFNVSLVGIFLAGGIFDNHMSHSVGVFEVGSPELLDLVSIAFCFSFIIDQFVSLAEMIGLKIRNPKSKLEGDTT